MQRKFQELYREALQKNQSISIGTMDLDSFGMSEIYSFSHIFPSFLSPWSVRTYPPPGGNHTTINHTFIFQKSTGYLISEHITYVTHIPTNYPYHTNCDRAIENVESKMNDKMDILHKSPMYVLLVVLFSLNSSYLLV